MIIPMTQEGMRGCTCKSLSFSLPVKVCAKCLEKRCRKVTEPKNWRIPSAVFVPSEAPQTKFSRNLGRVSRIF